MAPKVANHRAAAHAPATLDKIKSLRAGRGRERVNGYRLTFRLLRPSLPSPTVTASGFRDLVHPRAHRFLTARELARLQTFPDSWTFAGHRLDSFSTKRAAPLPQVAQIGNAVPPDLAFVLAQSIRKQLFQDLSNVVNTSVAARLPSILRRLQRAYAADDRLGNKTEPVDELVYIMLSRRTRDKQYRQGYDALRKAFPRWQRLLDAPVARVEDVLRPMGFAKQRGDHLVDALRQIRRDFGRLSLSRLKRWHTSAALNYLMSLKGVNEKSAKCVLMYAFGRDVFPIDTHVMRLSKRIGLLNPDASEHRATRPLEMIIPPRLRAPLHIAMIQHGRAVCLPREPKCGECAIRTLCDYGRLYTEMLTHPKRNE